MAFLREHTKTLGNIVVTGEPWSEWICVFKTLPNIFSRDEKNNIDRMLKANNKLIIEDKITNYKLQLQIKICQMNHDQHLPILKYCSKVLY